MAIDKSIDTVARTIYGEARSHPILDRLAVGFVIRERVLRPGWWGKDWVSVCRAPWQFTCWQDHDPKHKRNLEAMLHAEAEDPKTFSACYAIAEYIVRHATDRDAKQLFYVDEKNGLPTHYLRLGTKQPSWANQATSVPTAFNAIHLFYSGVQGNPKRRA